MTKTLAISIHKGGSGKTSLASNLGYALSKLGKKILLIDTDSQMNLSATYNLYHPGENTYIDKNFYTAIMERKDIRPYITKTDFDNIDFVVSSVELADIASKIAGFNLREFIVKDIIDELVKENIYDFIIIDTPPSLDSLNTAVWYASDYVLIPVEATKFGLDGLHVFSNYFHTVTDRVKNLEILGVVLNKVDKRRTLSNDPREVLKGVFGDYVLDIEIGIDADIENSQWDSSPIEPWLKEKKKYNPKIINTFDSLAKEVLRRAAK